MSGGWRQTAWDSAGKVWQTLPGVQENISAVYANGSILCTGAGAEFAENAKESGCDLFITGDVKHHQAQEAREMGINILDIGHYGSEKIFTADMAAYLRDNTDLTVIRSTVDLDPFVLL